MILPGLSPFEQPHYDELIWSWALRNAGKYSPELFAPRGDHPQEWKILLTLAGMLQGTAPENDRSRAGRPAVLRRPGGDGGLAAELAIAGRDPGEIVARAGAPGPERLLDFAIRTGPWGDAYGARPDGLTLEHLKQAPNGIDRGALAPRLDEVLQTASGRIELAPDHIVRTSPDCATGSRASPGGSCW